MKALILSTKKSGDNLEKLNDKITNAFEDYGKLWPETGYKVYAGSVLDIDTSGYDFAIFEMPWYGDWQRKIPEFMKKKDKNLILIGVMSAPSRFFNNINPDLMTCAYRAFSACDAIGVLDRSMIPFMKGWIGRPTYHLPVPIDIHYFNKGNCGVTNKDLVTLSVHSDIGIVPNARRGDISTFIVWKLLKRKYENLQAVAWVNPREQMNKEDIAYAGIRTAEILSRMYMRDIEVKFAGPDFLTISPQSFAIIQLTHLYAQSRISMYGASVGVPVISSAINETHSYLWPGLCAQWHRPDHAVELFDRLVEDPQYRHRCIVEAKEHLAYYYPDPCRKRLEQVVNESRQSHK